MAHVSLRAVERPHFVGKSLKPDVPGAAFASGLDKQTQS